jgi:hypothetical protein
MNKKDHNDLSKIWDHIERTNSELGYVKEDLREIKTDVAWLKRFFWIVAVTSVGGLITALFNLLLSVE